MIDDEEQKDVLAAGSHLPALLACVAATTGQVCEVGVGHSSTPALHAVCCPHRRLVSLESDPEWRQWFEPWYVDGHESMVDNDENIAILAKEKWGVVFVDDSPGWPRCQSVKAFLDVADYIVVHDAQGEDIMEPMRPIIAGIPQHMHRTYFPWTLVISKHKPLPSVPCKLWE